MSESDIGNISIASFPEIKVYNEYTAPVNAKIKTKYTKGFEIKCLECGSTDCVISYETHCSPEKIERGEPYIVCNNCYQSSC